jgi:GTP cyclohydrolase IA
VQGENVAERRATAVDEHLEAAPHLHVLPADEVDIDAAMRAMSDVLTALGQDTSSDDLADTPRRAAAALAEMLAPRPFVLTTFANDGEYDEMVIARDIPFHSLCAHHVLPFVGVAHVAYIPGQRIVGLSKLARLVEFLSHRLQTQERLTRQIADALQEALAPRGVGVMLEAEHLCMSLRGVQARGTRTMTTSLVGVLKDDPAARNEFRSLAAR